MEKGFLSGLMEEFMKVTTLMIRKLGLEFLNEVTAKSMKEDERTESSMELQKSVTKIMCLNKESGWKAKE